MNRSQPTLCIILLFTILLTSVEALADWQHVPGTPLKWVSTGSADRAWGIGETGAVFQWTGNGWSGKPGTLAQLSVGIDGTVWGVTANDRIYRWGNDDWVRVSGELKNIAVGSAEHIWGIGPTGLVFKWDVDNKDWLPKPDMRNATDPASQISVSADGSVWGVTEANRIYRWNKRDANWVEVSGGLKIVSAGKENLVWGVAPGGSVYSNTPKGWVRQAGRLKQLSVAADGTAWGVTDANKIYRWKSNGISEADRLVSKEMLRRRWPNGVVPFEIDTSSNSFTESQKDILEEVIMKGPAFQNPSLSAFLSWEDATNGVVRFVPRSTNSEGCYVKFFANTANEGNGTGNKRGITDCDSSGVFSVRLRSTTVEPDYSLADPTTGTYGRPDQPTHELGHVLGFHHEMRRPDRNDHISMYYGYPVNDPRFGYNEEGQGNTIIPEWENFIGDESFPGYDVNSVMQYSDYVRRGIKCNPRVWSKHDGFSVNPNCICPRRTQNCGPLTPAEMTSLPIPGKPMVKDRDSRNPAITKLDILKTQLMYGARGDWMANSSWCIAGGREIHVGDFNGDGRQDLLCHSSVPNFGASGRHWLDNADDQGHFEGTDSGGDQSQYCWGSSRQLFVGDFNADGSDDALCHNQATGQVTIDYANSLGHLEGQDWPASGFSNFSICNNQNSNLHVGDFDGDGRTDLLCHNTNNGSRELAYADSNDQFTEIQWITSGSGWCMQPERLVVGDFNGDGRSDALCYKPGDGHRRIDYVFSNGELKSTDWDSRNYLVGRFCTGAHRNLHVADINGDGSDDLLCHDPFYGSVWVDLANGDHGIGWRQGSGLWGSDLEYDLAFCNAKNARLRIGAYNGQDSRADLLCHNTVTGHKATLFARQGGIFEIPPDY